MHTKLARVCSTTYVPDACQGRSSLNAYSFSASWFGSGVEIELVQGSSLNAPHLCSLDGGCNELSSRVFNRAHIVYSAVCVILLVSWQWDNSLHGEGYVYVCVCVHPAGVVASCWMQWTTFKLLSPVVPGKRKTRAYVTLFTCSVPGQFLLLLLWRGEAPQLTTANAKFSCPGLPDTWSRAQFCDCHDLYMDFFRV